MSKSKKPNFPPGWDEERVALLIDYYESQSEEDAAAEAEAALESELTEGGQL